MPITVTGTEGADDILDMTADHSILGLGGDDTIQASQGNVTILGGDGNDFIADYAGSAFLYGEGGNDTIFATADGAFVIDGGDGDDAIWAFTQSTGAAVTINGGAGNDRFDVVDYGQGKTQITGGTGYDTYVTESRTDADTHITVTDFAAGNDGDIISFSNDILNNFTGYNGDNPFTLGYARLVQSGSDVLVQTDSDGPDGAKGFDTVLVLKNTTATALTTYNLGGVTPTTSWEAHRLLCDRLPVQVGYKTSAHARANANTE